MNKIGLYVFMSHPVLFGSAIKIGSQNKLGVLSFQFPGRVDKAGMAHFLTGRTSLQTTWAWTCLMDIVCL